MLPNLLWLLLVLVKLSLRSLSILLAIICLNVVGVLTAGRRGKGRREGRGDERGRGRKERGGEREGRGGEGETKRKLCVDTGLKRAVWRLFIGRVHAHSNIFFRWYFLASARSADEAAPIASVAEVEGEGEGEGDSEVWTRVTVRVHTLTSV